MISQSKNRVQAIKSKFESLNNENTVILCSKISKNCEKQLNKQNNFSIEYKTNNNEVIEKHDESLRSNSPSSYSDIEEKIPKPNVSYLYSNDIKRSLSDTRKSLTRQTSDPGKKLQRSHAFRCDRSEKINDSPKRAGSCNGRSETSDFSLKMGDKKLSEARLQQLGNILQKQMVKENFVSKSNETIVSVIKEVPFQSIPDKDVPKHILDQYAKVNKSKRNENDKQDALTDSGVSSETENVEEERNVRVNKLRCQFENRVSKIENAESNTNLECMDDLTISSETMRLERKNPHLTLTDTLKKALKQPLPAGPPPKKPPRIFLPSDLERRRKNTKEKLEVLEEVFNKREAQNRSRNIYDIAESDVSAKKPKEVHYLCTELLDITQRTLPHQNSAVSDCFLPLNCAIAANSTTSLPYTRLNEGNKTCCTCKNDLETVTKNVSTFRSDNKCCNCAVNEKCSDKFKCHLGCKCVMKNCEFYVDEPIYDEPFDESMESATQTVVKDKSLYGTLNKVKVPEGHSKSLEDLRLNEDHKIYDIPCDTSRSSSPAFSTSSPKPLGKHRVNFEQLRQSFENGPLLEPIYSKIKQSQSTQNLAENFKLVKKSVENKFSTEARRYKKSEKGTERRRYTLPKKDSSQLDVDRENLNRLMSELYDTVTAACDMAENKPGGFPTDHSDGSTSEESIKLSRSLTEKRKNYVRRVSSRVAYLDSRNINARYRHQTSICSYKSDVIDNQKQYSTFRSWKSFRASHSNLSNSKMAELRDFTDSKYNLSDSQGNVLSMKDEFSASIDSDMSIDEKAGCVDIELPFEPMERGLFNVCLLVGLNYMTGNAYVKSIFPKQVQVPPHIENLIFPETMSPASRGEWSAEAKGAQCYSLVLTDERGERSYGYCRRVVPEGATTCLPLCYCLIGKYRAPGFYYKILQEIESHHGCSETEINGVLQQLFETTFPNPGEELTLTYENPNIGFKYKNSANVGDLHKSMSMPDPRKENRPSGLYGPYLREENGHKDPILEDLNQNEIFARSVQAELDQKNCFGQVVPTNFDHHEFLGQSEPNNLRNLEFYDLESCSRPRKVVLSLEGEKIIAIKRPLEPRVDEDCFSVLLESLGAGLAIKVFGSLLSERKVVIISDQLSAVSSCMEALQSAIYPFVWQQPLISTIPSEIRRDVLEAPLPFLAGVLKTGADDTEYPGCDGDQTGFKEGILIDLTNPSKVLCYHGDESTLLPASSYKTLKTSLQMESIKNKDKQEDMMTRNVLISEAFLRFFVDILGDFWKYFAFGELNDRCLGKGDVVFDKESFKKNASSKQNQYFLEWFTETAMFNHFIQNMAVIYHTRHTSHTTETNLELVDTPLPNFYETFEERMKNKNKNRTQKNIDTKSNYKSAVNKRVKLLRTKLRDLIA